MLTPVVLAAVTEAVALSIAPVAGPHLATPTPIVGRAVCAGRVNLLTKFGELIELTTPSRPVIQVRIVQDLAKKPDVWGLACLADGSLWTLESGHSLVRITRQGRIAERIRLQLPWVTVFGNGDRLLFQALPIVAGAPVLSTAAPNALDAVRPWPGPIGRPGASSTPSIARNLLRCGLPATGLQPCWFVDDTAIVMSAGKAPWSLAIPPSVLAGLDRQMPIWDVAAARGSRTWVLARSAGRARGAADTMIVFGPGPEAGQIRLPRPARLIVFAADARCTVLLASGDLLEVRAS